jgi:drug/metabolite transporter (DMT)-like permease
MQRLDPLVAITWVMTFGALMVLPFGAADAVAAAPGLDAETWATIAWIVLAATVGTYALNAWALRHAPSSVVAVYVNTQPPIAAVLAYAFLGEKPGWATVAGAVLIALGIWLTSRR